jgi:hypothetical protein
MAPSNSIPKFCCYNKHQTSLRFFFTNKCQPSDEVYLSMDSAYLGVHQKSRYRSMPRRKKRNLLPVLTGFVVIIAVMAIYIYLQIYSDTTDTLPDTATDAPAESIRLNSLDHIQANLPAIQSAFNENRSRVVLPGHLSMPVVGEDINADGHTETVALEFMSTGQLHRELSADGFQGPVQNIRVFTLRNSDTITLLDIYPDAMKDSSGDLLISQVRADYGYAFRMSVYDGEPYTAPVRLIEIIILDSAGQPASDDLTVYWKPSADRYAATNTFGAPGTFGN